MMKDFLNNFYNGRRKTDFTPDDLPTSRWQLFWQMLRLHFLRLIQVNMTFILFAVPFALNLILGGGALELLEAGTSLELAEKSSSHLMTMLLINAPCMAIMGIGFVGMTPVLRNWARDEHAWAWQDFFDSIKENWRQGLLMGLVNGVGLYVLVYGAITYFMNADVQFFFLPLGYLMLAFMLILAMVNLYIWPMIVTYNSKFTQHLRNAFILALGRLPWTLLFTVISFLPVVLTVLLVYPPILLYYLPIGFALSMFISVSYTNAAFDRYINPKIEGAPVNQGLRKEDPKKKD